MYECTERLQNTDVDETLLKYNTNRILIKVFIKYY